MLGGPAEGGPADGGGRKEEKKKKEKKEKKKKKKKGELAEVECPPALSVNLASRFPRKKKSVSKKKGNIRCLHNFQSFRSSGMYTDFQHRRCRQYFA